MSDKLARILATVAILISIVAGGVGASLPRSGVVIHEGSGDTIGAEALGDAWAIEYYGTELAAIDTSGNLSLAGTFAPSGATTFATADLNGTALTIDADADTSLVASVDDAISLTLGAGTGYLKVLTGNLAVGNGTPDGTINGEDVYIEGYTEIDGELELDGALDADSTANFAGMATFAGGITGAQDVESVMFPTVLSVPIAYDTLTGTVATVADGEIWLVHSVFVRTTTNFDCTGDDCTLSVGDGNDADGFLALADASLQAAFAEATGFAAGWAGIENGSAGAYTTDDGGPFVYAPSGADETIDYAIGGTDPAAGAGVIYVVYTRIQ